MNTQTQAERLNEIVDGLLDRQPTDRMQSILTVGAPPFDISRPNIHDSKKDFLRELKAVTGMHGQLQALLHEMIGKGDKDKPESIARRDRLRLLVDIFANEASRKRPLSTPNDLALKNFTDTGFFHNSVSILIDMYFAMDQRLRDLMEQEIQFWNITNRAPQYYPRTIALRLARLFAREKRERPTFGTARDGNHPSTDFGRALEEVFKVLEIKGSVRSAATWAIEELTDEDVNPPVNALRGLLSLSPEAVAANRGRNLLAQFAKAQKKGS
jgi:hypothetical protein